MARKEIGLGITTAPTGTWVQTERKAHERWAELATENGRAAAAMHVIVAHMGRNNALVVSQATLAKLTKCSVRTLQRALDTLRKGNWLEIMQIGPSGTANAYVVNSRVAWSGNREGIHYSLFDATVLLASDEQPARDQLDAPLQKVLSIRHGERQLPTGPGLPPPSEPSLPGLEHDLPTKCG